ncbi:hypothetical protein POM88_019609 [Heracleum sosnowskyi]|uniref:SKP1 component dimerisation domain-containing protein n=1 Tax=Heracleum sosnowskyi TaxID=360622 RepID=A0AAD8MRA5_9APIA|nr:hypothetical protein POM88_019609 [Heracleum sosnowskyi]
MLMEVLNMTYLGNDKVKPEKQLGTIKLYTGRGLQYLYNVEHVDTRKPPIKYGDPIPLIIKGPTPTIFDDFVYLDFDLFCGTFKGIQQLEWEPCVREVSRKRVLFQSVDGTGWVLVNIGRFTSASVINVKFNLINNPTDANVSGVVFAANSELDLPSCASVLFLKNPGDEIQVGPDGVIPLSKAFVGVPLDCQLSLRVHLIINGQPYINMLRFNPIEEGVVEEFIPNKKEAKVHIQVTWGVEANEAPIYEIDFICQRKIKFWSSDDESFMVEEAVALELLKLRDLIKHSPYFGQHDLVTLFNLIQAAHHLQNKSLMDLTCQALANSVKTKTDREIMKMSNIDDASILNLKRTYSEEGGQSIDSILRQRGKETFINRMLLVDVPVSSLSKKYLFMFKDENPFFAQCLGNVLESVDSKNSDLEKLLEAIRRLHDLIDQDTGLVECLSHGDVMRLLLSAIKSNKSKDTIKIKIQSLALRILSHVLPDSRFYDCSLLAAPALVGLLNDPSTDISIAAVIALTRLVIAYHECYELIVHANALEIVQKIDLEDRDESDLIQWVAKFVAVMCSRGLLPAKVKVVLAILEDLLLKYSVCNRHMVSICYALHFLTAGRHADRDSEAEESLDKKIARRPRRLL